MKIKQLFILLLAKLIYAQDDDNEILSVNVDGLLMENANISASATCGVERPEIYCRLVDERSAQLDFTQENQVLCDVCDDRNKTKRHPVEFAKSDDHNLWWQSPSMAEGLKYQKVNVTIDLKQVYQTVYILLKMGNSPRPGNWILERSLNGHHYMPWIFFAETIYSCFLFQQQYPKLRLTNNANPHHLGDDEIFCTTYYSQPQSLQSGEIIISLINGRKSVTNGNRVTKLIPQKLIDFLSARYIRFRFLKHLTLAANLMTQKGYLEKSIYNRYYYSLRNIEIGGKCICNSHADKCDKLVLENNITVSKCNCKHNTCGNNCETCCPLFNQKQWRPIDPCEECNCNGKSKECVYNQTVATLQLSTNKHGRIDGGGVCINCQQNTEGINCEKCKMYYYRPWNILATEPFPCKPCQCEGIGSIGKCVSNGEETDNQIPGDCICKTGYSGRQCQSCDIGYERHINGECRPCPCSVHGSVTGPVYRCRPPCNCKTNVESDNDCKTCKNGYYNLNPKSEEGCQSCYCFGVTNQCNSLPAKNIQNNNLENWKLSTISGEKVTSPKITSLQYLTSENSYLDEYFNKPMVYYWLAPGSFLGNWLTSIGTILRYVVKIEISTVQNHGSQIDSPDVIIKCGNVRLFHSVSNEDSRLQRQVFIHLKHDFWKIGKLHAEKAASKDEFRSCLVKVNSLMIKAKYYSNQNSIELLNITLSRAQPHAGFNEMSHIEICNCPPGFSGLSCESCQDGHRRINNIMFKGVCEPCSCYGHSYSCNAFTGECQNCLHNTTGPHCEQCSTGFYGDAKQGLPNSCKRCACPLYDYQLTTHCSTFSDSTYICHDCSDNTNGVHCDRCEEGYYGSPMNKTQCKKCDCNDNEESCSSITGKCKCSFNTMGSKCELCKPGYFRNLYGKGCKKCQCDYLGSENQICNQTSGQCSCKTNFVNLQCDTCSPGLYLKNNQCVPCICNRQGRISTAIFCNGTSGNCFCKEGVYGTKCDLCMEERYGYPDCKKCQCSFHALSQHCDRISGNCKCGANVADTNCNSCLDSFYWKNRTDCTPCNCGPGSVNSRCDMNTGNCICAAHVTLRDCTKCEPGFYGLSSTGCKQCQICPEGFTCNNDGVCVCPQNTLGKFCEKCNDQSWNYNKTVGCQTCNCFSDGSVSQTCNNKTGQCLCLDSHKGLHCNECNNGYYGFPKCEPCNCARNGTILKDLFKCHSLTGQCNCKSNVMGQKCTFCKTGAFSTVPMHEDGCISCFCSGIGHICHALENHRIIENSTYEYHISNEKESFQIKKDSSIISLKVSQSKKIVWPLSSFKVVYVETKDLLQSSDLTFYYKSTIMGVNLSCSEKKCDWEDSSAEVILESYHGLIEFHYVTNHSFSNSGIINIELNEKPKNGRWALSKYKNIVFDKYIYMDNITHTNINISRDLFMMALMNVTSFKIKIYSNQINPSSIRLKLITYTVLETTEKIGHPVTSVEKCRCPSITTGNHCQNPVSGYYKLQIHLPDIFIGQDVRMDTKIRIVLNKCHCHGHSITCDHFNGHCFDCQNNTTGKYCDKCNDGFHGNPLKNIQCKACPCPSNRYNFAKYCNQSSLGQFKCSCKTGYSGIFCEKCETGYFGNPQKGIPCKNCECNSEGSLHSTCNDKGICLCARGVSGDKCDKCIPNFVVENKKCISCYLGCTNELLTRLDNVNKTLSELKEGFTSNLNINVKELNSTMENIVNHLITYQKFHNITDDIIQFSERFTEKKRTIHSKFAEAQDLKDKYNKALRSLIELLKNMNKTIYRGRSIESTGLVENATDILLQIRVLIDKMPNNTDAETFLSNIFDHIDRMNKITKKMHSIIRSDQLKRLQILRNKTKIADDINKDNNLYLRMLEKRNEKYNFEVANMKNEINNYENLISDFKSKRKDLQKNLQYFEITTKAFGNKTKEVDQIIQMIKERMKVISITGPSLKKVFIPDLMKKHFEEQINKSSLLINNLTKDFNFLHSAEQSKEAYFNISRDILAVDEAIIMAKDQLETSKSSLNVDKIRKDFTKSYSTKFELENTKENISKEYYEFEKKYRRVEESQMKFNRRNADLTKKMSPRDIDIESLKTNLSGIKIDQERTETDLIIPLKQALAKFVIPIENFNMTTNSLDALIENTTKQYDKLVTDSNRLSEKLKKVGDDIKYIQERLSRIKEISELAHGAAARSAEPIRHVSNCVRHYVTYYLPKSNAFSLEFYLKPQFSDQSLVLFGYDNSGTTPHAFAFTTEKNDQYKFWYDYGHSVETIELTKQAKDNYLGILITWKLGKWQMVIKSTVNDQENVIETSSGSDYNIINSIRTGPETHVFIGGFPDSKLLGSIELEGKLVSDLKENYKGNYFKGCLFGMRFMNLEFGLQDIEAINENCINSISMHHLLKQSFSCKINLENINKFKDSTRRQKRNIDKEFDILFNGNGYAMINTSKIKDGGCRYKLNKVLSISTMKLSSLNLETFQLVAVFSNYVKDIGFVLGQKNSQFYFGYWDGKVEKSLTKIQSTSESFNWNIFKSNIDNMKENIFGIDEICDPNSFFYLGDIPATEIRLRTKLSKLNVPNFGFAGKMRLFVNQKNVFQVLATRFINLIFLQSESITDTRFNSIFMSSDVNQSIVFNRIYEHDGFPNGFSFTVDFLGNPISRPMTLLTLESTQGNISLEILKNRTFSIVFNKYRFEIPFSKSDNDYWGPHYVVAFLKSIQLSTIVSVVIDNEEIKSEEMPVSLGQLLRVIIGSSSNIQHPYYIYNLFIGSQLIDFNEFNKPMPPQVFQMLRPTQLQPTKFIFSRSETLIKSGKINTKYEQSGDYPKNSAWFDGISNNYITLSRNILIQYWLPTENEISFLIRSATTRPEWLLSFNMENHKVLHIVFINGQLILFDSVTKWTAPLAVRLIDQDWHAIRIRSSLKDSERGITVMQDNHKFDFPLALFSFNKILSLEIGGIASSNNKLSYNNTEYEIQLFTGCMDSFKINNKTILLTNIGNEDVDNGLKQCPRILEFLVNGGHILKTYSQISDPNSLLKLKTAPYNALDSENTYVIKFKFKYIKNEEGVFFITGSNDKFCSLTLKKDEIFLNYRNFASSDSNVETVKLGKENWYKIEFIVFHIKNSFTMCKMIVGENDGSISLTADNIFDSSYVKPDFYFGTSPDLSLKKKLELTQTANNFAGCISDLAFLVNNKVVECGFEKSKYFLGGQCVVGRNSYLYKI